MGALRNRNRDADMAERLYREVFGHLVSVCPGFGQYKRHKGFLARMKRGIFFVVRQKTNMKFKRVRRLPESRGAGIISDELVEPALARSKKLYPVPLRRVTARVEVDGKMKDGMLVHLLLRFMSHVADWKLSFSRLAGVARAAVWVKRDLAEILRIYGTAPRPKPGEPRAPPRLCRPFSISGGSTMGQQCRKTQ
jgi:hypothetical protein